MHFGPAAITVAVCARVLTEEKKKKKSRGLLLRRPGPRAQAGLAEGRFHLSATDDGNVETMDGLCVLFPSHQLTCFSFLLAGSISHMFSQALPLGSPGLPTTNPRAWAVEQAAAVRTVPDMPPACLSAPAPAPARASGFLGNSAGEEHPAVQGAGPARTLPIRPGAMEPFSGSATNLLCETRPKACPSMPLRSSSLKMTVIVPLFRTQHLVSSGGPFTRGFLLHPVPAVM